MMICPTRGRPGNAVTLYQSWKATHTGVSDLVFALDDDDPELVAYLDVFESMPEIAVNVGERVRMVGTLNRVARTYAPMYPYLGFLGDDHRFRTPGWDTRFTECLSAGTGVVYADDLLQGEAMPTAVALTSDIVRTLGYMAPPAMVHLCVDLCWKLWGEGLDRITYLPDIVIEHMHPAKGKAAWDVGYEDANNTQRMTDDSAAYYHYRDAGGLASDLEKLRRLL